jgi:hypothetical protein
MSLTFNRRTPRGAESALSVDPLWLAAGLAMVALAACTFFLVPEESFTVAAGLLILLIAAADLRTGFLAFVVLYPFMPVSWGVDVASWMPYLTARRLCCLALAMIFVPHWKHAFDTLRVRRVAWIIVGLVGLQILVGCVSNDPVSAVKRVFGDVVECYLPFLMAAHLFRTKAQMRTLFTVAALAIGAVCLLGILEHTIDYNFYDSFKATRDDINILLTEKTQMTRGIGDSVRRVRVAFDHSIILGLHIMCVLLACVYLFRQKGATRRLFLAAGLPIFCLAMLFTYSRGPMLGLACGLVWLGLIGRGTRPVLLALLCGYLLAYQILPSKARAIMAETVATTTDLQSDETLGGGSARARIYQLQGGLQFSQQRLLLGHGPGEVRQTKMRADKGAVLDFAAVDNFYLAVLLNYGLIVLVATVALFVYLLGMFTRAALRITDPDMAVLVAVAAAICVANYVAMITMSVSITLFWVLLGPGLRAADLYQPDVRRRRPRGGIPRSRALIGTDSWKTTLGSRSATSTSPPCPEPVVTGLMGAS